MDGYPLPRALRGYDHKRLSSATAIDTGGDSLVQQQFREEVDINTIAKRFNLTGMRPSGDLAGVYGDFTGVHDYESALEAVRKVDEGFMRLPAEVRERFGNDPVQLMKDVDLLPDNELEARFGLESAPAAAIEGAGSVQAPPAAGTAAAAAAAAPAAPAAPGKV